MNEPPSLKIFRLKNRARNEWWCFARSLPEAKTISMKAKLAIMRRNITLVDDFTEHFLNDSKWGAPTKKAIAEGKPGIAGLITVPAPNWIIH